MILEAPNLLPSLDINTCFPMQTKPLFAPVGARTRLVATIIFQVSGWRTSWGRPQGKAPRCLKMLKQLQEAVEEGGFSHRIHTYGELAVQPPGPRLGDLSGGHHCGAENDGR